MPVEQENTIHWACISYSIMDQRQLFRFFNGLNAVFMANGMVMCCTLSLHEVLKTIAYNTSDFDHHCGSI